MRWLGSLVNLTWGVEMIIYWPRFSPTLVQKLGLSGLKFNMSCSLQTHWLATRQATHIIYIYSTFRTKITECTMSCLWMYGHVKYRLPICVVTLWYFIGRQRLTSSLAMKYQRVTAVSLIGWKTMYFWTFWANLLFSKDYSPWIFTQQ